MTHLSEGCVSDNDGEDSADGDGNDAGEQPPESAILLTMEFTGFPRVQVRCCMAPQLPPACNSFGLL